MIFNNCSLTIDFQFLNSINHTNMHVDIGTDRLSASNETKSYSTRITLPSTLEIKCSGKDQNTDTLIDVNGQVIADKVVIIKSIVLDNIRIPQRSIDKIIRLVTDDGQEFYSETIKHNGTIVLDFKYSDVFRQVMHFTRMGNT